jgi:hypothetical protein
VVARYLFLDVDGVLNTRQSRLDHGSNWMDPGLVRNLDRIVAQTGCWIVVHSGWRLGGVKPGSVFFDTLQKAGFWAWWSILGATGASALDFSGWVRVGDIWVVVDDQDWDVDNLVKTDGATGLTDSVTDLIIQRLTTG